jgi:DNA-binding NtrC family response regulator
MSNTTLVVDDEAVVRRFIMAVLRSGGFQAMEAENGVQALELLRQLCGAVEFVVSDIKMPIMDGIALASSVTAEFPAIPIILVSGYADVERAKHPGLNFEFVQKPFLPDTLLGVVKRVMMPKRKLLLQLCVESSEPRK